MSLPWKCLWFKQHNYWTKMKKCYHVSCTINEAILRVIQKHLIVVMPLSLILQHSYCVVRGRVQVSNLPSRVLNTALPPSIHFTYRNRLFSAHFAFTCTLFTHTNSGYYFKITQFPWTSPYYPLRSPDIAFRSTTFPSTLHPLQFILALNAGEDVVMCFKNTWPNVKQLMSDY